MGVGVAGGCVEGTAFGERRVCCAGNVYLIVPSGDVVLSAC